MTTIFENYIENNKEKSKIKVGDFVLLSDDIQSLKLPWIYPVGEVIEIINPVNITTTINQIKLKIKTYPPTGKKLNYVKLNANLSEIDKIIKKEECDKYINEWLMKLKAQKYNIL